MSDLDLLIKLARKEIESGNEEPEFNDPIIMEVNRYITAKNLKPGNNSVPVSLVYDNYLQFTKNPIGKIRFFKVLGTVFKIKKTLGFSVIDIDPVLIGLPSNYTIYKDHRFQTKNKNKKLKPSKYLGVYPEISGGWNVRIPTETGHRLIGHFDDEKEAANAYDKAVKLAFGDNVVLNSDGKKKT